MTKQELTNLILSRIYTRRIYAEKLAEEILEMIKTNEMKNTLRLPLKTEWFNLTESGVKTEDYREINPYWVNRLISHKESKLTVEEIIRHIYNYKYYGLSDTKDMFKHYDLTFKKFDQNIMTLGYPKSTDTEKILTYQHKGIVIRTGNPEWGAKEGKLYFVILHGELL